MSEKDGSAANAPSGRSVAFHAPRSGRRGAYVRVLLPHDFDETKYRLVDDRAEKVFEVANGVEGARLMDLLPADDVTLVALTIAQQCTHDQGEWTRVTDLARAVFFLQFGRANQTEGARHFLRSHFNSN